MIFVSVKSEDEKLTFLKSNVQTELQFLPN